MHAYTNLSSTSSVTGARTIVTEVVSISARPQVTYISPEFDSVPRCVKGFPTTFKIEGYSFDTITSVYLSAHKGVYDDTSALSSFTPFDLFGTLSGLSAFYPTFSGALLPAGDWHVGSSNTISVYMSATQGAGRADIILVNPAGYCTLYADLSTRIIEIAT